MKNIILYVTTLLPYPPDMGGKIKTLSTLKLLVKKRDVYLFSFVDKKEDLKYEKEMQNLGIKKCYTKVHPIIAEKHRITQVMILIKSLFSAKPYSVFKYFSKAMENSIKNCLKTNDIDIIWIDHTIQTQYLPHAFRGKKVLETHNYKTGFFKDMFFAENKLLWKLFSLYEWIKFRFYEPREFAKFDQVYAISRKEKERINRYNRNVKLLFPVIPSSDNVGKFSEKKLLFIGLLTWYPNRQGIECFIKEVFPELKRRIPEVTLDVIGDYTKKWKLPHYEGVKFHGYIKYLKPFWQNATVFIVPLCYGSGIRIKILEALSNGIPIVSTRVGADGLPPILKKNIKLVNGSDNFIVVIEKLLKNKDEYKRIVYEEQKNYKLLEHHSKIDLEAI